MKRVLLGLVCALLLCALAGCLSPADDVGRTEPAPTAEPTPTPIPTPNVPVMPDAVVTAPSGDTPVRTEDVTVMVHGEEEVISMTEVSGSFASQGGPDFALLADRERYQVNDVSGRCYITLRTGMSGDVYAEIGFRADTKASDFDTSLLDEYGIMGVREELGAEWLGNNRVRHLQGKTVQNVFDVYLMDVEGGVVTAVLCTTSETRAHYARLTATLETLEIFE